MQFITGRSIDSNGLNEKSSPPRKNSAQLYFVTGSICHKLFMLVIPLNVFAGQNDRWHLSRNRPRTMFWRLLLRSFNKACRQNLSGVVNFLIKLVEIDVGGFFHYRVVFCSGMAMMVFPIIFFYFYRVKNKR